MSAHDNEEHINYEDESVVVPDGPTASSSTNSGTRARADGEGDKGEKKFTEIHETGFRDFVLRPELLRALIDSGLVIEYTSEYTSEGEWHCLL
jgi:ATP-dependent RNA helicase UAP56/SUB2